MKWTAEIYLTWFFGRVSTMWRMHFRSKLIAAIMAKLIAMFYDYVLLPKGYTYPVWNGYRDVRYWADHEYGINWGVKKFSDQPSFMQWQLPGR